MSEKRAPRKADFGIISQKNEPNRNLLIESHVHDKPIHIHQSQDNVVPDIMSFLEVNPAATVDMAKMRDNHNLNARSVKTDVSHTPTTSLHNLEKRNDAFKYMKQLQK